MQATEKVRDSTFGSWSTSEIGLTIEYPLEVMEEIRAAVCDGLRRLAHGGLEVGGVLFGARRDTSIRLLTWRPIFCEHALGPSFRLSPRDCAELVHLLEVAKSDPDLEGLDSVGWFVSHARSDIFLTTADVEIYDSFFPALGQVTLVLQPTDAGPTRAGFFGRETGGCLRTESSYREFVVEPLKFLEEASQRELAIPSLAKRSIRGEPSSAVGAEAKLEPYKHFRTEAASDPSSPICARALALGHSLVSGTPNHRTATQRQVSFALRSVFPFSGF
jgi:hypothetical protein